MIENEITELFTNAWLWPICFLLFPFVAEPKAVVDSLRELSVGSETKLSCKRSALTCLKQEWLNQYPLPTGLNWTEAARELAILLDPPVADGLVAHHLV